MRNYCLLGPGFMFGVMKSFGNDSGDDCITL